MHFIVLILELESSKVKLLDKIFSSSNIFDIEKSSDLISHLHKAFLDSPSYPLYEQLFSHKDKLLSINSSFLSFNNISVPLSVVCA